MNILPLLVIGAAILTFFQDEFASLFRKLFARAWVRIFLPLILASASLLLYKDMYPMLQLMQARMHAIMLAFFKLFPFGVWSAILSQSLFLFLVSGLPVWGIFWWLRHKEAEGLVLKVTSAYLFSWLFWVLLWVA